jgi:hypothetical protein
VSELAFKINSEISLNQRRREGLLEIIAAQGRGF